MVRSMEIPRELGPHTEIRHLFHLVVLGFFLLLSILQVFVCLVFFNVKKLFPHLSAQDPLEYL